LENRLESEEERAVVQPAARLDVRKHRVHPRWVLRPMGDLVRVGIENQIGRHGSYKRKSFKVACRIRSRTAPVARVVWRHRYLASATVLRHRGHGSQQSTNAMPSRHTMKTAWDRALFGYWRISTSLRKSPRPGFRCRNTSGGSFCRGIHRGPTLVSPRQTLAAADALSADAIGRAACRPVA